VTYEKHEMKAIMRVTPDFLRTTNVNKLSLQLTKILYKQDDDISVPRNLTITEYQNVNNLAEAFLCTEIRTYTATTTLTTAFGNRVIYEADKTMSHFQNTVSKAVCGYRFTGTLFKTYV
jgi:hypothetical protein